VNPKAMYKTADGITMHNDARCIGCRRGAVSLRSRRPAGGSRARRGTPCAGRGTSRQAGVAGIPRRGACPPVHRSVPSRGATLRLHVS
jgi:hypothetical protein